MSSDRPTDVDPLDLEDPHVDATTERRMDLAVRTGTQETRAFVLSHVALEMDREGRRGEPRW